jgi:hypothetical protein
LEQPDDAAEAPAPELERAFDAAVPDRPSISPVDIETGRIETGVQEASPKMLAGEPIMPPLVGSNLPVAQMLTSCKVIDNAQQQPTLGDQGDVGSSLGGILMTPPKWQYAILSSVTLAEFQNTFKKLYKFSTVKSCSDDI